MCILERRAPYSDLAFPLAWHRGEGVHYGDQGWCSLGRFPTSFVVQIPMVSNSQRAMIIVSFVDSFFSFFWQASLFVCPILPY